MPPRTKKQIKKTRHRKTADPLALQVGKTIRALRDERDFVFDAFVEETGLGRGYISELERGLVVPSLHSLAKVATALELAIADLVLGDSARERLFEATRGLSKASIEKLILMAEIEQKKQ